MNPHDIATTGTWSLRVCQFRHSCTSVKYEICLPLRQRQVILYSIKRKVSTLFLKISVDIWLNVLYYNQAVARERLKHKKCRSGGIGRRAGFRCLWSQDRVGSSPISCIIFFLLLRMPELRIRLAVRHRMSLLFRLGSSSFFLLCNFFQHNRIFFCSYFVEKSILLWYNLEDLG